MEHGPFEAVTVFPMKIGIFHAMLVYQRVMLQSFGLISFRKDLWFLFPVPRKSQSHLWKSQRILGTEPRSSGLYLQARPKIHPKRKDIHRFQVKSGHHVCFMLGTIVSVITLGEIFPAKHLECFDLSNLKQYVCQGRWSSNPFFLGYSYNGYMNPYYWVDKHPMLYENHGRFDPRTFK